MPLWVPLAMLVVVFSSSLFAYLTLMSPAPARIDQRAGERKEAVKPGPVETPRDEILAMMALARERFRPTHTEPSMPVKAPSSSQPRPGASTRPLPKPLAAPPSANKERAIPMTSRQTASVATAAAPIAKEPVALETTPPPQIEKFAAASQVVISPIPRAESPEPIFAAVSVKESPVIVPLQKEPSSAVSALQKEPTTPVRPMQSEPSIARATRSEQPRVTDSWASRIRAELEACGKPGLWRNDLCRETVRWSHCHPNRWNSVSECVVERFASSSGSN